MEQALALEKLIKNVTLEWSTVFFKIGDMSLKGTLVLEAVYQGSQWNGILRVSLENGSQERLGKSKHYQKLNQVKPDEIFLHCSLFFKNLWQLTRAKTSELNHRCKTHIPLKPAKPS